MKYVSYVLTFAFFVMVLAKTARVFKFFDKFFYTAIFIFYAPNSQSIA
ncbi:hypothetical protein [Campylobacter devanensis]|nr:hypothetical protein [Campylobacter sp. P0135]